MTWYQRRIHRAAALLILLACAWLWGTLFQPAPGATAQSPPHTAAF